MLSYNLVSLKNIEEIHASMRHGERSVVNMDLLRKAERANEGEKIWSNRFIYSRRAHAP